MEELALYLFKSAVCNAAFFGLYACFFKHQTFFRFNRHFLITGLILSVLLPAYTYTYQVTIPVTSSSAQQMVQTASVTESDPLSYLPLLGYGLGILFLIMRYLLGLLRIRKIVNNTGYRSIQNYRLVNTDNFNSSFSVFNYIFIDKSANLSTTEKELVLAHELAHVRQHHWIDLMLAQLFCTLQWFNPLAWQYMKAIRQNHEYLADEAVLLQGNSAAVYRAILVNHCIGTRVFSFSSSFSSYAMPRIKMLSKPSSRWDGKIAIVLTIPAILLFYSAFAEAEVTFKMPAANNASKIRTVLAPMAPIIPAMEARTPVLSKKKIPKRRKATITTTDTVLPVSLDTASTKAELAQTPKKSGPLYFLDGIEVSIDITKIDNTKIAEIHVLKDEMAVASYGERGRNGVVLIYSRK